MRLNHPAAANPAITSECYADGKWRRLAGRDR
jgi:hypothetical protein